MNIVDVQVEQKPVSVLYECPYCGVEFEIDYVKFCDEHGDPPDWTHSKITCGICGQKFEINNQEWL